MDRAKKSRDTHEDGDKERQKAEKRVLRILDQMLEAFDEVKLEDSGTKSKIYDQPESIVR